MDRRNFLQAVLTAPLIIPYIQAWQGHAPDHELTLISDNPQRWLDFILTETSPLPKKGHFVFLNSHPLHDQIQHHLRLKGWSRTGSASRADFCISGSRLQKPAPSSFTLVENGRIRDIRRGRLYSLWQTIQRESPSRQLTAVSFNPKTGSSGDSAVITHYGRKIAVLPLSQNVTQSFPAGSGRITVKVEQGKAWVVDSSCRRKICTHASPVCLAGERIICAPNRFLLEIEGRGGLDTVIG